MSFPPCSLQDATAFAVQHLPIYPPHLAIAMRHSRRDVRFMIFDVLNSSDARSRLRPTAMCVGQRELPLKSAVKVHMFLLSDILHRLWFHDAGQGNDAHLTVWLCQYVLLELKVVTNKFSTGKWQVLALKAPIRI